MMYINVNFTNKSKAHVTLLVFLVYHEAPSSLSSLCLLPGHNHPQTTPDSKDEDNASMTSFGMTVRGLPLALASMTQTATSDSRFHPKWRAIAVATLLALVLMLYLHRTVEDWDGPTKGYYRNRVHSFQMLRDGEDEIFRDTNRQTARILARQHRREKPYNYTYPLSPPEKTLHGTRYRIALIADLDTASQSSKDQTWFSYMKRGHLSVSASGDRLDVEWDPEAVTLESHLAERGRGMFTELVLVAHKSSSFCARNKVLTPLQVWSCLSWWCLTVTCTLWTIAQVWCTGLRATRRFLGLYYLMVMAQSLKVSVPHSS